MTIKTKVHESFYLGNIIFTLIGTVSNRAVKVNRKINWKELNPKIYFQKYANSFVHIVQEDNIEVWIALKTNNPKLEHTLDDINIAKEWVQKTFPVLTGPSNF